MHVHTGSVTPRASGPQQGFAPEARRARVFAVGPGGGWSVRFRPGSGRQDAAHQLGEQVRFVRDLKRQEGMDIWLCGGGRLAGALIGEIDELIIKRYPLSIGSGIPLFAGTCDVTAFAPTTSLRFESGVDVTTYARR